MMSRLERIGGWALVGTAAGVLLGMSHHPTRLTNDSTGQIVHGFLILMLALTGFGYACFVSVRGATRPAMLAGAIAFVVAMSAGIAAAIINGFAVPTLENPTREMLAFAWALNQGFAKLGVIATASAILFWSADLLVAGPRLPRWLGCAGVTIAFLSAGPVLLGIIPMSVTWALALYVVQAGWGAALGLLMLAGHTSPDTPGGRQRG